MTALLHFIKTISLISLFLTAVWIIVPKGKLEKTVKYAIGVFFIVSVIISVKTAISSMSFSTDALSDFNQEQVSANTEAMQNTIMEKSIGELLEKSAIAYEKIEVITDISDDFSISITKAEITLENHNDEVAAKSVILGQTGITEIEFK